MQQSTDASRAHISGFAAVGPFWERHTDRRTHTMQAVPITINHKHIDHEQALARNYVPLK